MSEYIDANAVALFAMRYIAAKGDPAAYAVLIMSEHVAYAKSVGVNVFYCTDDRYDTMHRAAQDFYNFHEVRALWVSREDIDIDYNDFDRVGCLKADRHCNIMKNSHSEERDGKRHWRVIRITLAGDDA